MHVCDDLCNSTHRGVHKNHRFHWFFLECSIEKHTHRLYVFSLCPAVKRLKYTKCVFSTLGISLAFGALFICGAIIVLFGLNELRVFILLGLTAMPFDIIYSFIVFVLFERLLLKV